MCERAVHSKWYDKMIFVISKSNIKNNDKAKKDLFLQIIVLSYREGI